jgi:hypothetical protein
MDGVMLPGTASAKTYPPYETSGDFSYRSSDGGSNKTYSFDYSDYYFEGDSYDYDQDLAVMSLKLAMSAFNSANAKSSGYAAETAGENVQNLMEDMHFDG